MKRTTLFILAAAMAVLTLSSLQSISSQADCGGAVNISGPAGHKGCLTNLNTGEIRCFKLDDTGNHYEAKLCAGNYSICIEDWGSASFYSNGASEIGITVSNNNDCTCPGCP